MAYRKTKKYRTKRTKTKSKYAKKRISKKYVKKNANSKKKIAVKRVRGFKSAVKKVIDGERDTGTFVVTGAIMMPVASRDKYTVSHNAMGDYSTLINNFNNQYDLVNAAAVLFGGRDPNYADLTVLTVIPDVTEKITLVSDTLEMNFTNDGVITTMLEIYENTCIQDTDDSAFTLMYYESDDADIEYWMKNGAAITKDYSLAADHDMSNVDIDLYSHGGNQVRKFWKTEIKRVALDPQMSYRHVVHQGRKTWAPYTKLAVTSNAATPAFKKFQVGCKQLCYRIIRKMTGTADQVPVYPKNGNGYGLILNWRKTYKMVSPFSKAGAKAGRIIRFLNTRTLSPAGAVQYVERDGDIAVVADAV